MTDTNIPVLIVGGGAGLTASALLSQPGIQSLLQRDISAQGAVLVRPDRVIAWRSMGAANTPTAVLTAALSQIVGRA